MAKSLLAYLRNLRTSLFRRLRSKASRLGWERRRNEFRSYLRKSMGVESLEPRALMAVDANVFATPFAITMDAAGDTAIISKQPLTGSSVVSTHPNAFFVETNTPDPDSTGLDAANKVFIRTAAAGSAGLTVSDADGPNANQVLTIGGSVALS
ncbi:MAG: hypothetical protein ACK43N_01165, partial [Pirellulaceae bacterium]